MKGQETKTDNVRTVICPHCGAQVSVPRVVIESKVTDWPCVKCHRRFTPR